MKAWNKSVDAKSNTMNKAQFARVQQAASNPNSVSHILKTRVSDRLVQELL